MAHRLSCLQSHFAHAPEVIMGADCAADSRTPVALVLGAGAGVGQAVARKFAKEGFHAVVVRRGAGKDRLLKPEDDTKGKMDTFVSELRAKGGKATALYADGTVPEEMAKLVEQIETTIGPIHFVNYNIGAQVGDRTVEKTSYRIFELAWRLGALGGFACAKECSKYMKKRGHGTIVYTSATAAMRGKDRQHAHTAAMGARRMLCQSLASELGPKGIHIAHVNLDGLVNAPETVGGFMKLATGSDAAFNDIVAKRSANQEIIEPVGVADTYYHIHLQPKGVWTQECDIRPWTTKPWYANSETNATRLLKEEKVK